MRYRYQVVITILACITLLQILVSFELILPPSKSVTDWIDVIGKLGPAMVAVMVANLGRIQWKYDRDLRKEQHFIERQKFRLALFDKRTALADRFSSLLNEMMTEGAANFEQQARAYRLAIDGALLFEGEALKQFEELRDICEKLRKLRGQYNRQRDRGEDVEDTVNKEDAQLDALVECFKSSQPIIRNAIRIREHLL